MAKWPYKDILTFMPVYITPILSALQDTLHIFVLLSVEPYNYIPSIGPKYFSSVITEIERAGQLHWW